MHVSGIRCGLPYTVKGSVYTPAVPCLEENCTFTFSCAPKYELHGSSNHGDHVVRCGAVNFGLWDFGDLRCLGESLSLIGDSQRLSWYLGNNDFYSVAIEKLCYIVLTNHVFVAFYMHANIQMIRNTIVFIRSITFQYIDAH